jgi:autotransporter translocation and assembly factor TamB
LRGADAEGLARAIFDIGAPGVGAAVSGPLEIRWPRGRFRDLSGTMGLDAEERSDGRTPLRGRLEWRAEAGRQTIERADLKTSTTHAILAGRIEPGGGTDLSVDAESTDLQSTDGLLLRLRRALGASEAQATGFGGSGTFQGRWGGTLHRPAFSGRFSGQDITYLDVLWGHAEWAGTADPDEVGLHSLVLKRGRSELWLDGRAETGAYGDADAMDMRARFQDWPAEDFAKALDWEMEVSGPISGEARLGGRRSVPTGSIRASGTAGRYFKIPWTDLDLAAELRGAETRVSSGRASVGGGRVRFQGTSRTPGLYDGSLEMADVDVGDVMPSAAPGVGWGGRVSLSLTFQGTLDRPRLSGHLTSPRLFLGDEGIGAIEASFEGDGTGSLGIRARCRSARVDVDVDGRVGAVSPFTADLQLRARRSSLDPFLRTLSPRLPSSVGIVTTGEARVQGPLAHPPELLVQATASELEVLFPEYPIRNGAPLRFDVEKGRVTVREFRLAGEGTDLRIEGDAGLAPEDSLRVEVRGEADLRALAALTQKLRGRGAARLSLDVSGTRASPRAEGTLDLEGGGLRVRGFPHGLEGVRGTLRFTESAAVLSGVTGTLAGGSMELQGQASYSGGRLSSFEIQSTGRGMTLRYPEGLRSLADADLRCFGDSERQWLTGSVDVRQALWSRRYDVASELLAESRGGFVPGASLGEGVHLGIRVRAPGTLKVDNNLATLQARAELMLQGTTESPVILGRAEIERGRVYFQGNTYVIRRGSIDFANPERIDPHFEIEAEARVRSYRVTLRVDGTLERVYPTLTSDPPLSALQILNLLAGADESAVTSMTEAQTEQGRLAATGAASLAAGRLAEQVGLERGAERLFGLNRFSIDPALVRGTNPTARLTVGKRLTSDLSVVYSVDLRGTGERLLSVEYSVSDRFSVLLTQSEVDGYGFDVRLRQSH